MYIRHINIKTECDGIKGYKSNKRYSSKTKQKAISMIKEYKLVKVKPGPTCHRTAAVCQQLTPEQRWLLQICDFNEVFFFFLTTWSSCL